VTLRGLSASVYPKVTMRNPSLVWSPLGTLIWFRRRYPPSKAVPRYDEASRLIEKTDINGNVTEFGYRKDHLLKTLTVKRDPSPTGSSPTTTMRPGELLASTIPARANW